MLYNSITMPKIKVNKGGCKVGKKEDKGGCKEGKKAPPVTGRLATKKTKVQGPPQQAKVVAAKPRVAKVAKVMPKKPAGYETTSDKYQKFINHGYYEKGSLAAKLTEYGRPSPSASEINRITNPLIRNDVIGTLKGMHGNLKKFPKQTSITQEEADKLMKQKKR